MSNKTISDNNSWNFNTLTKVNFAKKRQAIILAHDKFIAKWQKNRAWLKDPLTLQKALADFEILKESYSNGAEEAFYCWLRSEVEENNTEVKAKFNQVNDFVLSLENKLQFFELSLARLPKSIQAKFSRAKNLQAYKHYLEKIFATSPYLLSDGEEKLMRLKSQSSYYNWVKMTSEFLSAETAPVLTDSGKLVKKSLAEISTLSKNQNKKVRDDAATKLNQILVKNIKVGENELNSILADKKVNDELRHMSRPDLARHLSDDIDSATVDAMIKIVSDNFSVAKKYYQLKAKMFKVKKLKYHERSVSFGDAKVKYSYEKAKDLLRVVLSDLDPEFLKIFNNFDKQGLIDVYPRTGKTSGAFCAAESLSMPTFIMLNHNETLNDVLTLAHEVGHGINNEMMRQKQSALNFGATLATAEVSSTFFEDFILKNILRDCSDEVRLEILMEKLNNDVSTIFRQAALYLFEQELHQEFRAKGYLSAAEIGELFKKHMAAYMGDYVEQSKGAENWWLQWSHIRNYFYVYSYVSGLLISKHFQKKVAADKKFVEKVKYFLSAGLSESPRAIFAHMGININDGAFWQEGIKEIKDLLVEAETLAKKLKKI